jgi:hypothetical protein
LNIPVKNKSFVGSYGFTGLASYSSNFIQDAENSLQTFNDLFK